MHPTFFIEIDSRIQNTRQITNIAMNLSQRVGLDAEIFFECIRPTNNYYLIRVFLYQITKVNPFSKFRIFIENDEAYDSVIMHTLQKSIVHKPNYWEYLDKYFADLHNVTLKKCDITIITSAAKRNSRTMKTNSDSVRIINKIATTQTTHWRAALSEALHASVRSIFIKFVSNSSDVTFIAEVLQYIYEHRRKNQAIYFSDFIAQSFYYGVLINKQPVNYMLKECARDSLLFQSHIIHVDRFGTIVFEKFNVRRTISKLFDLDHAYTHSAS